MIGRLQDAISTSKINSLVSNIFIQSHEITLLLQMRWLLSCGDIDNSLSNGATPDELRHYYRKCLKFRN